MTRMDRKTEQKTYRGVGAAPGTAHARLDFHLRRRAEPDRMSTRTRAEELSRFEAARARARAEIEELTATAARRAGEDAAGIFEIHGMLLDDEDLTAAVTSAIDRGLTAESAVRRAGEQLAAVFDGMEDEYLRERAADMRDVAERVCDCLDGGTPDKKSAGGGKVIIVAADLSPAETVKLDPAAVLGFVTFGGSRNSHTAILAREMGIPAVVMTGEIPESCNGCDALLDGDSGTLTVDPPLAMLEEYACRADEARRRRERLAAAAHLPAVTLSGKRIRLMANIGSPAEAAAAAAAGADGIGLFRSEFLYLGRTDLPGEEEQLAAYRRALDAFPHGEVIVRTLDVGADKKIAALPTAAEENPALGVRGIRFCFENPDIFRTQLRALCRASAFGALSVMIPMVVCADEVGRVRTLLREVQNELRFEEYPFDPEMPLGIMLETPAAALMCDRLCAECDFFSVGTNDLCQYTLAADRQNGRLETLIEQNTEPVFRLISGAADAVHRAGGGKWLGVCGELAADPSFTARFVSAGVDELSVAPPYVAAVKDKIRSTV